MASQSAKRHRLALGMAKTAWALAAIGAIGLSLSALRLPQQDLFNWNGWPQLWQFFRASLHPDLSPSFLQITAKAALTTLAYAICSTACCVVIGLVVGVLMSEVWWRSLMPRCPYPIGGLLRTLLTVPRAIHELIWGLFFVNILGLDPLVAVLAIVIPYSAIVAKVFAELLDEVPRHALSSLLNSGIAPPVAFLYTLLPQAGLDLLSYSLYRFECSLRSATVLGIIGAGGLGYEVLLSLQSLRYEQLWTLFYALWLLNGGVDISSALLRRRLGSPSRLDLNWKRQHPASTQPVPSPASLRQPASSPDLSGSEILWQALPTIALVMALFLIPWSIGYIQADVTKLWSPRTAKLLAEITQSAMPVDLSSSTLGLLVQLSGQTLAMSILAITLAGLGGMLLSFPAAHTIMLPGGWLSRRSPQVIHQVLPWVILLASRSVLLLCRAIPAPIWALVVLFVVFPGLLPGAIALGLHNLGILGRLMAEVTENLDQRPLLALKAQGAPALLVFLYGVLPMTLTRFLAYILYRWEVCLRETVIVGLVGAGGLGRQLTEQLSSFDYSGVVLSLGGFIVLTIGVDWISGAARRSLR